MMSAPAPAASRRMCRVFRTLRMTLLLPALALGTGACTVVSVASSAVSVAGTVVGAGVSVASTAVGAVGSAGKGAYNMVHSDPAPAAR